MDNVDKIGLIAGEKIENKEKEIRDLKNEIHDLKEQLKTSIPRRRVRRVFRQLKKILEQDIISDDKKHIQYLKDFITTYRNGEVVTITEDLIIAIEHSLGLIEIGDDLDV